MNLKLDELSTYQVFYIDKSNTRHKYRRIIIYDYSPAEAIKQAYQGLLRNSGHVFTIKNKDYAVLQMANPKMFYEAYLV